MSPWLSEHLHNLALVEQSVLPWLSPKALGSFLCGRLQTAVHRSCAAVHGRGAPGDALLRVTGRNKSQGSRAANAGPLGMTAMASVSNTLIVAQISVLHAGHGR